MFRIEIWRLYENAKVASSLLLGNAHTFPHSRLNVRDVWHGSAARRTRRDDLTLKKYGRADQLIGIRDRDDLQRRWKDRYLRLRTPRERSITRSSLQFRHLDGSF
ncbi:hypothetical protein COMA2_130109 [Candidatus Nitrospira nitrificans]|uniref:Uncharacterized protein n=1 Tax=Candidatus Nitrospira nitrificans TaxID=1742973 RepID=A0A0S4L9Q9_9BACT|nr:hypothetical protein COMA2_130109 [Candidatus Nitrospira nitrificans]